MTPRVCQGPCMVGLLSGGRGYRTASCDVSSWRLHSDSMAPSSSSNHPPPLWKITRQTSGYNCYLVKIVLSPLYKFVVYPPVFSITSHQYSHHLNHLNREHIVFCSSHRVPEVQSGARVSQFVPNVLVWQTHLHSVPERTGLALLGQGAHLQVSNSSRYCIRAFHRCLLFVAAQGIPRTRSMRGSSWINTNTH